MFESQPFHFFVMSLSSSWSGSEPLCKNLTGMLPSDVQVKWTQSTTHPNESINIFSWGWIMRKCPSCTFLAMRKAGARLRLEGLTYRLPSWCSSQSLPVCKKWCVSTSILLHGQNPSLSDNHIVYTSVRVASNASFTLVQYCKRCPCEPLYTPVMLWLHIDCQ